MQFCKKNKHKTLENTENKWLYNDADDIEYV